MESERYLSQYVQPGDLEKGERARLSLKESFGQVELENKSTLELSKRHFMVDVSCHRLSSYNGNDRYWLDYYILQRDDRENAYIELEDVLPRDYRVTFTAADRTLDRSRFSIHEKVIDIDIAIDRKIFILALLHEAGHVRQYEGLSDKDKSAYEKAWFNLREASSKGVEVNGEDAARVLMWERGAWAFALKKIKPFLDSEDTEDNFTLKLSDIKSYIHNDALGGYNAEIADVIEKGLVIQSGQ